MPVDSYMIIWSCKINYFARSSQEKSDQIKIMPKIECWKKYKLHFHNKIQIPFLSRVGPSFHEALKHLRTVNCLSPIYYYCMQQQKLKYAFQRMNFCHIIPGICYCGRRNAWTARNFSAKYSAKQRAFWTFRIRIHSSINWWTLVVSLWLGRKKDKSSRWNRAYFLEILMRIFF